MSTPENQIEIDGKYMKSLISLDISVHIKVDFESLKALQSPSSIEGSDSKRKMISSGKASAGESDKKSIGSHEFMSAEAIDDEIFHSPPADFPAIDIHYKQRMGSK